MEREEEESVTACADCGAALWTGSDRHYAVSDETFLCWTCAVRRGGVYDGDEDRWTVVPDATGLSDERRPHP